MGSIHIGIDLGTTNSTIAAFDGEVVTVIPNGFGENLTPSVVRIDGRGGVVVGRRACRYLDSDPANTRNEFKRLMGTDVKLAFAASGAALLPEALSARILASLLADAADLLGFVPRSAVISTPALFELPQNHATTRAGQLAGLEEVLLIQEPVASAIAAGWRESSPGLWLIYDLGGGTLDISLLETRDGRLRVVDHAGDNFLGGKDFDNALADWALDRLREECAIPELRRDNPAVRPALARLKSACEHAKIELSRVERTAITVPDLCRDDAGRPEPEPVKKPGTGEKILGFLRLKRKPRRFAVDAGTVLALALAAEVRGEFGRADRFLHAFDVCPPEMKPTGMLRRFAVEELAWRAAARGDWPSVRQRVRLGSGRAMPLLKMLADARLTGTANRLQWWLAWSISPSRRRAWPFVLAGAKGGTAVTETPAPNLDGGPRSTHLDLLRRAADGAPVAMATVFRLARRWDEEFAPCREEALLRRGMALGARDVLGIAGRIKRSVLEELEELAAAAEGEIPPEIVSSPEGEESSCAAELAGRLKNRLYDDVSRAQALFDLARDAPVADEAILDLWERWLVLREAVARFQSLLGAGELATLWYGGLRETAWNSTSRLFNACGGRIAWISIIQFHWVSEIAERLGDEEAMTVNRNNMTVCGYRPPFSARLLLVRLSSPFHRLRDRARKMWRRYL